MNQLVIYCSYMKHLLFIYYVFIYKSGLNYETIPCYRFVPFVVFSLRLNFYERVYKEKTSLSFFLHPSEAVVGVFHRKCLLYVAESDFSSSMYIMHQEKKNIRRKNVSKIIKL